MSDLFRLVSRRSDSVIFLPFWTVGVLAFLFYDVTLLFCDVSSFRLFCVFALVDLLNNQSFELTSGVLLTFEASFVLRAKLLFS